MIRPIDIRLNAAHPELPLCEAVTFTGSPSTVLIRGVPPNCGRWAITAVFVAASFPDGSTTTRAAVQSANGVWVATLPATATSGRTANGIRIMADGVDENGEAVTGYILGVADFAVASLGVAPAPAPGETSWQLLYFDAAPATPRKGDVTKIDGVLKFYNGSAWEPFADLSNYYTAEQVDEAIDKLAAYYITADAQGNPFATHAALVNAQTYYSGGAVRTPTRNDYAVVSADETHGGAEWRYIYAVDAQGVGQWEPQYAVEGVVAYDNTVTRTSSNGVKSSGIWSALWGALAALPAGFSSLYDWCVDQLAGKASKADATLTGRVTEWVCSVQGVSLVWGDSWSNWGGIAGWVLNGDQTSCMPKGSFDSLSIEWTDHEQTFDVSGVTATRTALPGYQLGSQTTKPLASEAEAEALRTGKQNTLTAQQLANIAAVSDALAFDATHTYAAGDPVVYNGTLYTFTAAHTGAWTGSDVSAVDIITRLAGKLDKSGGTMTGALTMDGSLVFHDTVRLKTVQFGDFLISIFDDTTLTPIRFIPYVNIALTAPNPTAGNLASLDANGNPTDSQIPKDDVALKGNIPYDLVTKTIANGAVSLDDRASNAVTVSTTLSPNTLTINFPTATSGKVRDFAMRLNIAAGVTAPEIAWPQGVTLENNGGEVPEIADGGTGGSSTILYFSETENNGTTAKFLVKGETLTAIAQA